MKETIDLPALIKALSEVPPERQWFVGVMILLILLLVLGSVILTRFLYFLK